VDVILAATGALGMVVAALSRRLRQLPVSEPLLGLLAGVLLGPAAAGVLTLPPLTEWTSEYHQASRLLLAVSVMAVAPRFPFHAVRKQAVPVLLLLAVAMPVMAAVNSGLAWLILGMAPAPS
jgi:NhaP-type Na+/H+ or K+/H+ antiporter